MKKRTMKMNLRRALVLVLTLLLTLSAITVSGSAAYGEVLEDGTYVIYTECLYTCLNVQYKKTDGGKVCVDTANLETNETWVLKNVGGGYVTLSPQHAPGYYLSGENGFDKQLVIRKTTATKSIYHWKPVDVGGGAYVFVNRSTGYVIDIRCGENTKVGCPVLQYTRNGFSAAQSLYLVRISHFTAMTPSNREYNLSASPYKMGLYYSKDQVLNAQYGLKAYAWMVCDPFNNEANEVLYIQNEGNGLYSIRFASNTSLCVAPSSVFAGAQMQVKSYDGSLSCLYEVYKVGDTYSFRNAFTGLFIDDLYARVTTGTKIIAYSYNGDNAQRFYLTKVSASSGSSSTSASSGYATYTGVNYRNLTDDSRRIAACDKAVQMATVLWTNTCEFPTWRSSGGVYNTVTATDGTSSTKFLSGKTYQGIPYSMAGRTYDDVQWLALVKQGLSTSKMTGKYYRSYADTTAKGIDCSYLVCTALNAGCGTSINLNTKSMLNSSRFKEIYRSWMLPGDVFLKSGHVMFFLGKTSSGKYAVIEANAAYSRVVYRELSSSEVSGYGCYRYTGFN